MNYNEKKYKNYRLRKVLRIVVMILSIVTITLAILNLVIHLNIFYAIMSFLLTTIFTKYRKSLEFYKIEKPKKRKK